MAWYDNKAKVGYGQVTYPYHIRHSVLFDMKGKKHVVVGYSVTKTQNYVADPKQVVEFRDSTGIGRMELRRGTGDKLMPLPWDSLVHDRPHEDDGFYSKVHNHVAHGKNMGLPWNSDAYEPSRLAVHDQSKGPPRNKDESDTSRSAVHDPSKDLPRNRNASDPTRSVVYGQGKGSPRNRDAYESSRFISSPSKDHYYNTPKHGKNNHFSDDEDDVTCEEGVCFLNKKGGSKPFKYVRQEDYDKEKHRGDGYAPKKDSYHETSYPDNNNGNHKGYGYGHVPSYSVRVTTPPGKDPYYETSTNKNTNRPMVDGPRPIKTRAGAGFSKENVRNSPASIGMQHPQYNGSPRKDHGYKDPNHKKASPRAGVIDVKKATDTMVSY